MAKSKSLKQIQKELTYESRKYDLEVAARKFNGNFSIMAKDTGISVQQIQSFYRTHPDFKEIVDVAREALYHTALAKLAELIEEGNVAALNLFFNRSPWAKQNGWSDRIESEQKITLSDADKAKKARELLGIDDV